jgi:hypothetical protein
VEQIKTPGVYTDGEGLFLQRRLLHEAQALALQDGMVHDAMGSPCCWFAERTDEQRKFVVAAIATAVDNGFRRRPLAGICLNGREG